MPAPANDVARQMAGKDLKLVWYHSNASGKRKLDHVELQAMSARALNTTSLGFKGPTPMPRELLTEMLQLKLIEKVGAESDNSRSVFHLTEAGRARGQG